MRKPRFGIAVFEESRFGHVWAQGFIGTGSLQDTILGWRRRCRSPYFCPPPRPGGCRIEGGQRWLDRTGAKAWPMNNIPSSFCHGTSLPRQPQVRSGAAGCRPHHQASRGWYVNLSEHMIIHARCPTSDKHNVAVQGRWPIWPREGSMIKSFHWPSSPRIYFSALIVAGRHGGECAPTCGVITKHFIHTLSTPLRPSTL